MEKTGKKRANMRTVSKPLNGFTSSMIPKAMTRIRPVNRYMMTRSANPEEGFLSLRDVRYAKGMDAKPNKKNIRKSPTLVLAVNIFAQGYFVKNIVNVENDSQLPKK